MKGKIAMKIEEFDEFLVDEHPLFDGVQKLYRFPNGFGASVVRHFGSYGGTHGLWEIATVKWDDETGLQFVSKMEIEGWLTLDQVAGYLKLIQDYGTMYPQSLSNGDKGGLNYAA